MACLRRHSRLPVVFTVRSRGQGGRYADDDEAGLFARTCQKAFSSPLEHL